MEKLPIKISLDEAFFSAEKRCDYEVTCQSKQLWAVLLDLLVTFDSVCKEYNIQYSIDGGTLLGAVRHGGFIPWDDDIDVIMLRSEYKRLCQIAPTAFKAPYFWQTNATDPGSMRRHGQLRNSLTTCILNDEMVNGKPQFNFNQGIFIDVFVLDEVPDDANELSLFRKDLDQQLEKLWYFKEFYWASGKSLWMMYAQQQAFEEFEKVVSRCNGTNQMRVGNVSLLPQRKETTLFPKILFEDLTNYLFEGIMVPGPQDYDTILTGYYGNWHQFVIGDNTHGNAFVDTMKSYKQYVKNSFLNSEKVYSFNEEHPILTLYNHKDTLLMQRDIAWKDITKMSEEIDMRRHEQKRLVENLKSILSRNKKLRRQRNILMYVLSVVILTSILYLFLFFI